MPIALSAPHDMSMLDQIDRVVLPDTVQTGVWIEEHGWLRRLFKLLDNTSPKFRWPDLLGPASRRPCTTRKASVASSIAC